MTMKGSPVDQTDDKSGKSAPTTAEVTINGKKYVVDKAMAEALEAESAKQREILEAAREAARKAAPRDNKPESTKKPEEDDADLLFTDPSAFKRKLREEIETDLRGEYEREKQREAFWDRFYKVNDDLKKDHQILVEAVMNRDYQELVTLPVGDQFTKLGDRVRDELLRLAGKSRSDQPSKRTVVEGADNDTPRKAPADDEPAGDDKVVSIADVLKAQRQARIDARTKRA